MTWWEPNTIAYGWDGSFISIPSNLLIRASTAAPAVSANTAPMVGIVVSITKLATILPAVSCGVTSP